MCKSRIARLVTFSMAVVLTASLSFAQDQGKEKSPLSARLAKATKSNTNQKYSLKYKFKKGDVLRWKVEQVWTTTTRANDEETIANNRTTSVRKWEVQKIFNNGNVQLVYTIENRTDWSKITGQDEVSFDSDSSKKPPRGFEQAAAKIGIPLAQAELDQFGNVISKKATYRDLNLNMGGFSVNFPKKSLSIGEVWTENVPIQTRQETGGLKHLKLRKVYKLLKVEDDIATVSMKTQVLTPVNSSKIQRQIMQHVNTGKITFDIKEGRLLSNDLFWNHTIQGDPTPDSILKYRQEKRETFFVKKETKATRVAKTNASPLRGPDDKPILRY